MNAATILLKDTPIVVNRKDEVSGQAEKPIYLKTWDNDGQTQRTEQATGSLETVRAGYTVIDPVEDNLLDKLPPTTLKSFNLFFNLYDTNICFNKFLSYYQLPLLPSPQTLETFFSHLKKHSELYNTVIISIKNDYSEAHVYSPETNLLD